MKCSETREKILESGREFAENLAKTHLSNCSKCREFERKNSILEEETLSLFCDIEVPQGLGDRLEARLAELDDKKKSWKLKIPGVNLEWLFPRRWIAPLTAVAAMLMVFTLFPGSGKIDGIDQLTALALKSHVLEMPMEFRAGNAMDIPGWFEGKLSFDVVLPQNVGALPELVGGRKCSLGKEEVGYLFYGEGKKCTSLFILDGDSVSLPSLGPGPILTEAGEYRFKIWKENGLVYVTVGLKGGEK